MIANDIEGSRRRAEQLHAMTICKYLYSRKNTKKMTTTSNSIPYWLYQNGFRQISIQYTFKRIKKKRHISAAYIFPKLFFAYAPPSWPAYINNDPECFSETCRNFQVE